MTRWGFAKQHCRLLADCTSNMLPHGVSGGYSEAYSIGPCDASPHDNSSPRHTCRICHTHQHASPRQLQCQENSRTALDLARSRRFKVHSPCINSARHATSSTEGPKCHANTLECLHRRSCSLSSQKATEPEKRNRQTVAAECCRLQLERIRRGRTLKAMTSCAAASGRIEQLAKAARRWTHLSTGAV